MTSDMIGAGTKMPPDPASVYGPLDVGADWATFNKVSKEPFLSETHGGRMVEVYVNDVGLAAYKAGEGDMPVGSIVVKSSKDDKGVDGPLFVMEKRAAGYDRAHGDWYYAIHWANPPAEWLPKIGGGPIFWRSPSPKAAYCAGCHDDLDRNLGGVPKIHRAW